MKLAMIVTGGLDTPSFASSFLKPFMKGTAVGLLAAVNESGQKMVHQFLSVCVKLFDFEQALRKFLCIMVEFST